MVNISSLKFRAINLIARLKNTLRERGAYPEVVYVFEANAETVSWVKKTNSKMVAEIGIYQGHTSLEIAKVLNGAGELHLFDFQDRVQAVNHNLESAGFRNVRTFGSSYKLLDSYNWPLAKLLGTSDSPIYDYVFLDGAHTFAIDALTFFLADKLLKVGGYMDFDDYEWSLGSSPSLSPARFPLTAKLYTQEQIDLPQVKMIVDILVRKSGRYVEVVSDKVFQKIA